MYDPHRARRRRETTPAIKSSRVRGVDAHGKVMWLTESLMWGEAKDAGLFTKYEAWSHVEEINIRSLYADREDRITAAVERAD